MRDEPFEYRANRRDDGLELNRRDGRQVRQRSGCFSCFEVRGVRNIAEYAKLVSLWSTSCDECYGQKPDTYESAGF